MEVVNSMDLIREYWWLVLILVALVLTFVLLRPKQRVTLTDSAPVRPHMQERRPPEGRGIAGEAAAATSDLTGTIFRAPVHQALERETEPHDDLCQLKGVGPKFAEALREAGFTRYEQLAHLTPTEVERLDARLGTFAGRIRRDRIVEQADYLARGDRDGFEQSFGKL
jgi:predicted flap endonuclease-1-like 5' DNA nuclease